jgi:hypothetical protein
MSLEKEKNTLWSKRSLVVGLAPGLSDHFVKKRAFRQKRWAFDGQNLKQWANAHQNR